MTTVPIPNVEACASIASANRLIATRFAAKASQLLELLQSLDDLDERLRIADLIEFSEKQSKKHACLATLQERDLGVTCHCHAPDEAEGEAVEYAVTTRETN